MHRVACLAKDEVQKDLPKNKMPMNKMPMNKMPKNKFIGIWQMVFYRYIGCYIS